MGAIDRNEMEPGDYSGIIGVTSNGGDQNVIANMTVSEPPLISISITSLDFETSLNSQAFTITNSGGSILTWSVKENPDKTWITSIEPLTDSLTAHQSQRAQDRRS